MDIKQNVLDLALVAVDLETTGGYPIGDEICEVALVRYEGNQVVDRFQSYVKPQKIIPPEIVKIHGLSNESLKDAPEWSDIVGEVAKRLESAVFVAHHAPFDAGFLARAFEKQGIRLPETPILCSSLLSRKLLPKSPNHRLQTLIAYLNLEKGVAHSAGDDAKACLDVVLKCFEQSETQSLEHFLNLQEKPLIWKNFSIATLEQEPQGKTIVQAIEQGKDLRMNYQKEGHLSKNRELRPIGVVRNPDGDYLYAFCLRDKKNKRFYLSKISDVQVL